MDADSRSRIINNASMQQQNYVRRIRRRRHGLLLTCTVCYLLGGSDASAAAKTRYLRHGGGSKARQKERRQEAQQQQQQQQTMDDTFECPLEYTGFHPTPGCRRYYWCENGARTSSMIYSCSDGLMYDEKLLLCNWEGSVTCRLESDEPTMAPTVYVPPTMSPLPPPTGIPTVTPPTAMPTIYTFQQKPLPHGKQVIGYWHGSNSRASAMTPNQLNYTKVTRINYATYTTNQNGKIYIKGKNGNVNNEDDILTLLGPYVWSQVNDGSIKEYCKANPNSENMDCINHEYERGMLHLAHLEGVEVYPSITLDGDASLMNLDKVQFTKSVIMLLRDYEFDGLDLNFLMLQSRQNVDDDEMSAFHSLLSHLRSELVKAMVQQSRSYGLSIVMSCINIPDLEQRQSIVTMVDELNLVTFDMYTQASSDVTAPHAPLYSDPMFLHGSDRVKYSVDSCVNTWIDEGGGVSQDKVNVGLSFYGQSYKGTTDMYQRHGVVENVHLTRVWTNNDSGGAIKEDASIPYYEIYPRLQEDGVADSLITARDDVTKTEYAYAENDGRGGTKQFISYENDESICDKAQYGIENEELNGFFIWEITGDILDNYSTPLLDAINLKLTKPEINCDGTSASKTSANNYEGKVAIRVNGETIIGEYGPPIYYPDYGVHSCSGDAQTKPLWVSDNHLFSTKQKCCEELFEWIGLESCLGDGFVESNIINDPPTPPPSASPTVSPSNVQTYLPTPEPSMHPSSSPFHKPSASPTPEPSMHPSSSSPSHKPSASPTKGVDQVQSLDGASLTSKIASSPMAPSSNTIPTATSASVSGLCAKDESELLARIHHTTAQSCTDNQPCPEGLKCITGVSASSNNDTTQGKVPSNMPTNYPAFAASSPRTSSPTPGGIVIQVDEDSTISAEDPNKIYGFNNMLVVDGDSSKKYDTLLKFDISFMETVISVEKVMLRLFVVDGSGYCGSFTTMSNTGWMENAITYAKAPANDGVVMGQAWDVKEGEWFEIDVTGAVNWVWNGESLDRRSPKKYLSIRITSTVANRCIFSSSNGPSLQSPHLLISLKDGGGLRPIAAAPSSTDSDAESAHVPLPVLEEPEHRNAGEALLLRATDDAIIVKEQPKQALGHHTSLIVDKNAKRTQDILIRFNITEMHQTVPQKAVMALYIEEQCESAGIFSATSRFDANWEERDDDHWNEEHVSWSTAPFYESDRYGGGTMIGSFGQVETDKWFGFDVIQAFTYDTVSEQTTITFRVSSDDGKHCKFASKQSGKAAKLILEF